MRHLVVWWWSLTPSPSTGGIYAGSLPSYSACRPAASCRSSRRCLEHRAAPALARQSHHHGARDAGVPTSAWLGLAQRSLARPAGLRPPWLLESRLGRLGGAGRPRHDLRPRLVPLAAARQSLAALARGRTAGR